VGVVVRPGGGALSDRSISYPVNARRGLERGDELVPHHPHPSEPGNMGFSGRDRDKNHLVVKCDDGPGYVNRGEALPTSNPAMVKTAFASTPRMHTL
jgi:hypothetical protein